MTALCNVELIKEVILDKGFILVCRTCSYKSFKVHNPIVREDITIVHCIECGDVATVSKDYTSIVTNGKSRNIARLTIL